MAETTITTKTYKLYPSPRNRDREIFAHEVFVAHMYALVDPPSYDPQGRWSLFAAHRLADPVLILDQGETHMGIAVITKTNARRHTNFSVGQQTFGEFQ